MTASSRSACWTARRFYYTQGSTAKGFDYEVALGVTEVARHQAVVHPPMDFADLFTAARRRQDRHDRLSG